MHASCCMPAGIVYGIHGARLQFEQALRRLGAPAEDERLGKSLVAPIVIIAGHDDLVAALPSLELERAGANGLLQDVAGCAR